jgi:hypothetical protein
MGVLTPRSAGIRRNLIDRRSAYEYPRLHLQSDKSHNRDCPVLVYTCKDTEPWSFLVVNDRKFFWAPPGWVGGQC